MRPAAATSLAVAVLLAVVLLASVALQSIPEADPLGKRLLYLPSEEMLRIASLGNEGLAADLLYIWAIQYYSEFAPTEKFLYLETVFNLITDLDPRYFDAYRIGALIMSLQQQGDATQHKKAIVSLYEKGLRNMPDSWELAEAAAWDAHLILNDQELAVRWIGMAAERPGALPSVKRVYGRWKEDIGDWTVEDSIQYWQEVLAEAKRKPDVKLATSHLYDSYVRLHRQTLDPLLAAYRQRTGRCPESWQQLVDEGFIDRVPVDYVGNPYTIDPESCTLQPHKQIR